MTLYFIGLGLDDEKDITVKGMEAIKNSDKVYLECYTSMLNIEIEKLENFYGKRIILADRELVEKEAENTILKDAEKSNVAFLVVGDVFGATTHTDIFLRAKEKGIDCKVFHNTSIINAVSETGLELYKFGKTTSLPFPTESYNPTTAYDVITANKKNKMHTLVLLDIKSDEKRYMAVNQAIEILLDSENKKRKGIIKGSTLIVGCARIGSSNQTIFYGTASDLVEKDFGKPLHCLIVPSELHFIEEEMLNQFKI